MNFQLNIRKVAGYVLALVVVTALLGSFYTVGSDQRALLFRFGNIVGVEQPGLHFKIPYVQSVQMVDIRTQHAGAPAPAGTFDMQSVNTNVSVNFHFDITKLPQIYNRTGMDVGDHIVDPRIQESVKAVVAHYNAEQLLKEREMVRQKIVDLLRSKLADYNLELEDIQITDFQFDPSFSAAIEAKQVAEQQALTETNNLAKIKILAQQKVATAQGDADASLAQARANAESIKVQGDALKSNPMYLELKKIEKWDGAQPRVALSAGTSPLISVGEAK